MYISFGKRLIDLVLGLILSVLTLPVFIVVFIILVFSNNGSPFFFQKRPGLKGKVFRLIKFKTMAEITGENGELLEDDKRLTNQGKIIRKLSLDELPQLWNVLKGEMSIIGPRPLLEEYLDLYSDRQSRRHDVRPGITGWAQVNGRNEVEWEDRFELDIWYVDNLSFLLDMKIIFLTIQKIIKREGINKHGHASMPKFTGNRIEN